MKRTTLCVLLTLLALAPADAQDRLGQIEQQLREAPVQEKIYLHMDNTCYFKGDSARGWTSNCVPSCRNRNT